MNRLEWISVDDRSPDMETAVLTHLSNFGMEVDCMEYSDCGGLIWRGNSKQSPWIKITHWMELPDPPQ